MATRGRRDYPKLQRTFGRRIPRERSARCLPLGNKAAQKRASRLPSVSDLFRSRAGTLALVLALTVALWAVVFAVASLVWSGF
jgi:hypothetical protein